MKGPRRGREERGHSNWFQLNTDFIIRLGFGGGGVMVSMVVAALKHITFTK